MNGSKAVNGTLPKKYRQVGPDHQRKKGGCAGPKKVDGADEAEPKSHGHKIRVTEAKKLRE